MKFLTSNVKTIVYLVERIGISVLLCGFLSWLVFVKLERIEMGLKKVSRNQIAAMKKLGVTVVRDVPSDRER